MKPRLGNLPVETTSFVGRKSELSRVKELLSSSRELTLTGAGGVGKTRLALRLAGETHRAFPDGVWLVELADLLHGDLVALSVANSLGIRDESTAPLDRLISQLRDRHLLLILDNCEHLADACAVVIGKLLAAAPAVRVVATSRHVLGVEGEMVFQVPPLSHGVARTEVAPKESGHTEALTLFEERARAADPDFRITDRIRATVLAICQRLDGIPLAIELAAVRVRSFTVDEILNRLDDALHLLTAGERTRPPRHRTIEATIQWSFDRCTTAEQQLWARLSAFSGGFTADAAEQVCAGDGIAVDAIHETLSGLVDKSIVRRTPEWRHGQRARFQMLELVRQFGAARLASSDSARAVRQLHRDFYQELARRSSTDYCSARDVEWFQAVRQDLPNLRAALEFSISEPGEARAALEIAACLRPFWYHEGFLLEGYRWLLEALELDTEPTAVRARALAAAGFLGVLLEDVEPAREQLAACRRLGQIVPAEEAAAEVAVSEAMLATLSGDLEGSIAKVEAAAQMALALGNPGLAAEALAAASTFSFIGQHPRAGEIAQRYLELTEQQGANLLKAVALWLVGLNRWRRDDQSSAERHLREAITLFKQFDQPALIAACFEGLAWSAAHTGDHERAVRLLGSAKRVWRFSQMRLAQDLTRRVGESVELELRSALGGAGFTRALETGESWSLHEATEYALSGRLPRPETAKHESPPSALTRRELDVARLVARGLTNRQIAAELVIATRTVDGHVDNILRKLGFRSRTQIARWLADN